MKRETRTQLTTVRNKLLKSIRSKCVDCSAGSSNEVKLCPVKNTKKFIREPRGDSMLRKEVFKTKKPPEAKTGNSLKGGERRVTRFTTDGNRSGVRFLCHRVTYIIDDFKKDLHLSFISGH